MRIAATFAIAALFVASITVAQVLNVGLTIQSELTGDGVDDEIKAGRSVVVEDGMSGTKYVVLRADAVPETSNVAAYALNLDRKAPNELVIEVRSPAGLVVSSIYSLKGGKIEELGQLPGGQLSQSDLSEVVWFVAPNSWENGDKLEGWNYPAAWDGKKWSPMRQVSSDEKNPSVGKEPVQYSYSGAPGEAVSYRIRVKSDDLTFTVSKSEQIVVPPSGAVKDTIRTTKEAQVLERGVGRKEGLNGSVVCIFPTTVRFLLNNGDYYRVLAKAAKTRFKVVKYAKP
jgi:hypothetical protein